MKKELLFAQLLRSAYFGEKQFDNLQEARQEAKKELKEELYGRSLLSVTRFDRRMDKRNYKLKKTIKARDGKKCKRCGESNPEIKYEVAHHLPVELFPEYAFEEWNAEIQCFNCNHKNGTNSFRKTARQTESLKQIFVKLKNYSNET